MLDPVVQIPVSELLAASCLTGATVFQLTLQFQQLWISVAGAYGAEWEFEELRKSRLRRAAGGYRLLEPLVQLLKGSVLVRQLPTAAMELALRKRATEVPWKAEEFVAFSMILAVLCSVPVICLTGGMTSIGAGVAVGALCLPISFYAQLQQLRNAAEQRVARILQQMAYCVDLMAMTMQAGAGLTEAMEAAVSDNPRHPLSQELRQVLEDYRRWLSLGEAFAGMEHRLQHAEIREFVKCVDTSRQLGTPVARIFSDLAAQMRLKKLQGAEAAAGEAKVRMQGPVMIIMVACMLVAVFPFVFQFFVNWE